MFIDQNTIQAALNDLSGTADHMVKIWFVLKAMGMTKTNSVLVNTANSTPQLRELFHSGSSEGSFCVPFVDVSSKWRFMKIDASRSIIQTNIKKWMDGTVSGSDPTSILDISKDGDNYRVSEKESYPEGLGASKKLFAPTKTSHANIPLLSMAAWVFVKENIPDSENAEDYLRRKLRDYLHLDHDEESQIFSPGNLTLTFTDEPISDSALYALCKGQAIPVSSNHRQNRLLSRQLITYGAPGTGKSHKVDGLAKNPDVAVCVRTTFHPDSDYATFVGAYKPVMDGEKIAYKFRPQAFMNAYVKAWKEMSKPEADGKVKSVVLVIEEINRGNCAQIFGDLFQLLDRDGAGYSQYPIDADSDLCEYLKTEFSDIATARSASAPYQDVYIGKKLALPPNLYIWATMNTSDQSLFPIDSAFKRRWDWEYVPIAKPDKSDDPNWKERKIEVGDSLFDWWDFLSAINGHIAKATESEDKQLGYFFVKADDATGYISAEQFANKVLFYLYGDVFKSYELPKKDCFQQADNTVLKFRDFFYSEKVEEGESESRVTHKPGDVRLEVVAAFLRGLKWKEKGVKEEPKAGAVDANLD